MHKDILHKRRREAKKGKDVEIKTGERSQKRNEHKTENVDVMIDIEIVSSSSSLDFFVIFFSSLNYYRHKEMMVIEKMKLYEMWSLVKVCHLSCYFI